MTPPRNTKGQFTKRAPKEAPEDFSFQNPNNRITKKPADDFDEEAEALAEAICKAKLPWSFRDWWEHPISEICYAIVLLGFGCIAGIAIAIMVALTPVLTFDVLTTPVYPKSPDPIINPRLELDRPNSPPQVFLMIETTQAVQPSEYRVTGWRNGEPMLLEKR